MGEQESVKETEADGVEPFDADFGNCVTLRSASLIFVFSTPSTITGRN